MVSARIILTLLATAAAVSGIWSWVVVVSNDSRSPMILVAMFSVPVLLAAVTVLIFSFVRFEEKNGKFLVNKNSLFLKFATMLLGPTTSITICSLFWGTIFSIIMTGAVLMLTIMYGHLLVTKFSWQLLVGPILVFTVGVSLRLIGKDSKLSLIALIVAIVSLGSLLFFLLVVWPVMKIMAWGQLSLVDALLIYCVEGFRLVVGMILFGGITLLIFGAVAFVAFLLLKSLKNSTVGKILTSGWQSVKSKTCPIISAVSYKD